MQTDFPLKILAIDEITDFVLYPKYTNIPNNWIVVEIKNNCMIVNRFYNSKDYANYMHDLAMYYGEKRIDFYHTTLMKARKRYIYICYL